MARARSTNVAAKYQASWEKFKQQSKGSSDNTVSEDHQLKAVSVSNNSPTDTSNSRRVSFHGVKDSNNATYIFKSKQESQTKHPKLVEKKHPWKNLQIEIVPPAIVPQQQLQFQSQQLPTHSINTNKTITRRRPRSTNTNNINTTSSTTTTITKMETPSSNNVSVVVRLRPIVPHESKRGATKVVHKVRTIDAVLQKKKEDEEVVRVELAPNLSPKAASNNRELVKCFALDGVLEEHDTQTDVYKKSGAFKAVTQDLFRGFHCTILAYGQSGSGKTYTMGTMAAADLSSTGKGSEALDEQAGVIQRACHDLFQQVEQQCMGDATVELSYLEIYNEEVRDLLSTKTSKLTHSAAAKLQKERERLQQQEGLPLSSSASSNGLQIREDPNGEVFVQGKTSVAVTNATQVIELMRLANAKRVVASTKLNDVSSRSHAICILTVTGTNSYDVTFQSRLTLVDLAGSERLSKTENTGMRIKEGININVGLFVLGLVISALTETRPAHKRHPPYRESKLTRILQNSLGGNARTIMIACISPTDYHAEETCNTLRYATQARNIENPAVANVIHDEHAEQVLQLQSENDHLLKNNLSLQEQLAQYESLIKQMSSELNHVKQHYETTTLELREVKQDYQTTAEQLMEIQEDFKLTVEQLHRQKIEDVIKNKRQRQKKLSSGQYLYSVYHGDDEDLLTDANNTPTRSISSAFNSIGTEPTADLTIGTNAMSPNRLVPPPHLQSEEDETAEDKSISRLDEEEEDESVPVSQVAEDSCDQSQAISLLTEHQEWNSTVENNPLLGEMKDDDEDISISKVMDNLEQEDDEEGSLHSLTTEIHEPFSTNYQPQDEEEEKKDETCDSSYQKCKTSAASKLNCNDSLVDKESEVMVEAVPVSMPYNDLAGVKMPISPKSTASLTKEDNSLTSGTITQGSQATKNSNSKRSALKRFMSKMNCMSGVYGVVQNNSCTNPKQSAHVERV